MHEEVLLRIIQKQQEMIDLMLKSGIKISDTTLRVAKNSIANYQKFDAEGFKKHLFEKGRSENSTDTYIMGVKLFFRQYTELNSENLSKYEQELKNKLSPKTVNLRICGMNAYLEYVGFKGYQFHRAKEQKRTFCDNAINKEQYERLISWAKDNSPKVWLIAKDIRTKAILEFLLSTGCRVSEVSSANKNDIDNDKLIITGKGNKQRYVYLNAAAKFALSKYFKTRIDDNEALFVSKHKIEGKFRRLEKGQIEKLICDLGKKAGVENCHPHKFRRTMATDALRAGMPIEQVALMLGHEELSTTQIYARSDESDVYQAHKKYVR